jgi:glutamine cyclotransferase
MRLMPVHLVLGAVVFAAVGVLVVLARRPQPVGSRPREVPPLATRRMDSVHPVSDDGGIAGPSPSYHLSSAGGEAPTGPQVARYRYKVIKVYPHDRRFFTQGLVYEDGFLYEGTGLYGQSALYRRDLRTGRTVKSLRLPDRYFGEGITVFGDRLVQLTWQSGVGFVYTKDTFTPLREFQYAGEGWGLTHDGKHLILSNGTATLRFLDPNTFAETGRLEVRDRGRLVPYLNELEYVADRPPGAEAPPAVNPEESPPGAGAPPPEEGPGSIYANIWGADQIAVIDPATGRVTGWIDLSGLYPRSTDEQAENVLNGIAYLPQTKHLLVTGKRWPRLYEIELVPQPH